MMSSSPEGGGGDENDEQFIEERIRLYKSFVAVVTSCTIAFMGIVLLVYAPYALYKILLGLVLLGSSVYAGYCYMLSLRLRRGGGGRTNSSNVNNGISTATAVSSSSSLSLVRDGIAPPVSTPDVFPFSFEDTPRRIRSCEGYDDEDDDFGHANNTDRETGGGESCPANGTYSVIYSAVYFGKMITTKGKIELQFTRASDSSRYEGWEIRGNQIFGKEDGDDETNWKSHPVVDGFVNRKGHVYWVVSDPLSKDSIYRGIFDIRNNVLHDGEFQAGGTGINNSNNNPPGRIVRLELQKRNNNKKRSTSARRNHHQHQQAVEMVPVQPTRNLLD